MKKKRTVGVLFFFMRGIDGRTPLQRSVRDMRIVGGHRIFGDFAVEEGGSEYKEFERSYFALYQYVVPKSVLMFFHVLFVVRLPRFPRG